MLSKIITWLLFVFTFSLRMKKNAVIWSKCPLNPQPTVCIVYNVEGFGLFKVPLWIQLIIQIIIMQKQVNIFVLYICNQKEPNIYLH